MAKRTIRIGEKTFTAEDVPFQPDTESGGEKWSNYILEDGTSLKLRAVVAEVLRLEGEYGPNGDPIYTVNASLVVSSASPENLRKKGES